VKTPLFVLALQSSAGIYVRQDVSLTQCLMTVNGVVTMVGEDIIAIATLTPSALVGKKMTECG
jgi:hypothetical protein